MNDDDLDSRVAAVLRDLPPVDDVLKNQHIATALAQVNPSTTLRAPARWLGAAAAVVALIAGVSVYRSSLPLGNDGVSATEGINTTMPAKTGGPSSESTVDQSSQVECPSELEGSKEVGDYEFASGRRKVNLTDNAIEIVDLTTCRSFLPIAIPSLPRDQTVCIPSLIAGTQLVGPYVTTMVNVIVLASESDVTIIGGPQCAVVARVPQPESS